MVHTQTGELGAFCSTCPTPEAVIAVLQELGFHLTFQMDAITYPASSGTPHLPAQYHFCDGHGTEVIYLAGRDAPLDGERFPRHQARFWLYAGSDTAACKRVLSALTARWLLTWQQMEASAPGLQDVA